jgi:hypothetical protein
MQIAGSVDTADSIHCKILDLDFFQNVGVLLVFLFNVFTFQFRLFSIFHSLILLETNTGAFTPFRIYDLHQTAIYNCHFYRCFALQTQEETKARGLAARSYDPYQSELHAAALKARSSQAQGGRARESRP